MASASIQGLVCLPSAFVKTIYLIRHGEAWSNVAGEKDHSQYLSEEWFDASLSPTGWKQAEALNKHIRSAHVRPQLIVVSPLTRALQTAAGAFGAGTVEAGSAGRPLMVDTSGLPGKQTEHAAISSQGVPPMMALELVRERLHGNPCDRRRTTSVQREAFPYINFDAMTEETDVLWHKEGRETPAEMQERGAHILKWLLARPETEIALVSHSGILHAMLTLAMKREGQSESVDALLDKWPENCELRTITLADPASTVASKHYADFAGGHKALE